MPKNSFFDEFSKNSKFLKPVETLLIKISSKGIYDHLGGGISRYTVDEKWIIPHFEKMLYDQAMLSMAYLEAYHLTKNNG